jgi:hypothetical protein
MKRTIILRDKSLKASACQQINACEDGKWRVVIEPHVSKRSLNQLAYLFGVVYERIRHHLAETGQTDEIYSAETWHEYFKGKFLPTRVIEVGTGKHKEQKVLSGTTTKLSVIEMRDFIEQVVHYAADKWQVYIPAPGEFDEWESAA